MGGPERSTGEGLVGSCSPELDPSTMDCSMKNSSVWEDLSFAVWATGMMCTVTRYCKPVDIRLEQTMVMAPSKPLQRIYCSTSTFLLPAIPGTIMKLRYGLPIFCCKCMSHRLLSSHMESRKTMLNMCACAGVFWGVWQGLQGLGSPRSICSTSGWEKAGASGARLWQSRVALV